MTVPQTRLRKSPMRESCSVTYSTPCCTGQATGRHPFSTTLCACPLHRSFQRKVTIGMHQSYGGRVKNVKTLLELCLVSIDDKDAVSPLAVVCVSSIMSTMFRLTRQDGRTMLDYAKIGLMRWQHDDGNKDTVAFLQSCSCISYSPHSCSLDASHVDKSQAASTPAAKPIPVDSRVAFIEKQVADLTVQLQSMQAKPGYDASTAPTASAPPSGHPVVSIALRSSLILHHRQPAYLDRCRCRQVACIDQHVQPLCRLCDERSRRRMSQDHG